MLLGRHLRDAGPNLFLVCFVCAQSRMPYAHVWGSKRYSLAAFAVWLFNPLRRHMVVQVVAKDAMLNTKRLNVSGVTRNTIIFDRLSLLIRKRKGSFLGAFSFVQGEVMPVQGLSLRSLWCVCVDAQRRVC